VPEDINSDLSEIANDLSISDRIETMGPKNAFVTVKDHKENFKTNPKFRLINPAKSELGKISKITLDNINSQIRKRTKVNQWKNSMSVIDWFNNIKNKLSKRNVLHLLRMRSTISLNIHNLLRIYMTNL
jgi:hypothetical protein